MVTFFKKILFTAACFLVSAAVFAQTKSLTNGRVSSFYTYIYSLTSADVAKFYGSKGKQLDAALLHTLIDSFKTDSKWVNNLPAGNYLQVYVLRNQLQYELIENHTAFIRMFSSNLESRFAVTDKAGNYLNNVTPLVNYRTVKFDKESGTWYFNQKKDTIIASIDYGGVSNFYHLVKDGDYGYGRSNNFFKKAWAKLKRLFVKNPYAYVPDPYSAIMVFNKPRYKPGDSVKLKAFVFNAKTRKPATDKRAVIMLYERGEQEGKLIGKVDNYRAGGFDYRFKLTDSLNLSLDNTYIVKLLRADAKIQKAKTDDDHDDSYESDQQELNKLRKATLASGEFEYEEYELKAINFNARLDKKEHRKGEANSIYLKATDENDLPVADARVFMTVLTSDVSKYYGDKVFIKDTLWTHKQALDAVGETKVTLPDSIFPKADIRYSIVSKFLNANNESRTETSYGVYNYADTYLKTEVVKNKLNIALNQGEKSVNTFATVSALDENENTLSEIKVTLPGSVSIDPQVVTYNIVTDSTDDDVKMIDIADEIAISGERTADSAIVMINNPRKLKFFYTIMDKSRRIDGGQCGGDLNLRLRYANNHLLTLAVDYLWAGRMWHKENSLVFETSRLNVMLKQPASVYPGQRASTTVLVTDAAGKPVSDADVTAWSITRKFDDYHLPFVPNLGRYPFAPKRKKTYSLLSDEDKDGTFKLNWIAQSKRLGLDSIEYFKFTHPTISYSIAETGRDTVTQVAPFAVQDGELLPVHVVYIDEVPVYFSKAQQVNPYSFKVSPGMHRIRLRTSRLNVVVDSVMVSANRKNILSFNTEAVFHQIMPDTLDAYEAKLINSYLITINNNFEGHKAVLKQEDRTFFLNPDGQAGAQVLVGPLANGYSVFENKEVTYPPFSAEANYAYLFEPNWVKQKSLPTEVAFNKHLRPANGTINYRQYVLTNNGIDSLWNDYLDRRSNSQHLVRNEPVTGVTGRLIIERIVDPKNPPVLIKNVILFKPDDVGFIRVYPGATTEFDKLNPGVYRAFYLLKADNYEIKENIVVKAQGINYLKTDISPVHCKDAVSDSLNKVITNLTDSNYPKPEANEKALLKLREAYNSKYLDRTTFANRMSGVVTSADDGLPLPGVSVIVDGTDVGTNTGVDGHFDIGVPEKGRLRIQFIGFARQFINIEAGKHISVKLKSSVNQLNEVVVVGYGQAAKKQFLSYSTTDVDVQSALAGKVAGVQVMLDSTTVSGVSGASPVISVRGISTVNGKQPLYVVDGIIVTSLNNLKPSEIETLSLLNSTAATALYGAQAANGVVIISTKHLAGADKAPFVVQGNADVQRTLRQNFSDYAYWQPRLITDRDRKATFNTVFPDDITNWRTFVIAANGNRQTGYTEGNIKSFKPLSANFIAPQFAVVGDGMKLIAKVMNYNAKPAEVERTFSYNGKINNTDKFTVTNARIDTFAIAAANVDSLEFEYSIKRDNGYFDGEKRTVPVYKPGITEVRGTFAALSRDTTITMTFDRALGPVVLRAEASLLPVLEDEARQLRDYKYLCNEQLASKLKGLLVEKRIAETLRKKFEYDKDVKDIIKKLSDNRKTPGTWGWWKDSEEELWITLHATEALVAAEQAGYTTALNKQKLTDYLVYQLESYNSADKLRCLQLLKSLNAKVDYVRYINVTAASLTKNKAATNYERLQLMLLKQQSGIKINVDSLKALAEPTMFGNRYWGTENYSLFNNSIQQSILAYKIIRNADRRSSMLGQIQGYLLEQRRSGYWRNTYESAQILETVLPDLIDNDIEVAPATLTLSGNVTKVINKFPYADTVHIDDIKISKTGKLPVYITGYQQLWNSNPVKVNKDFIVDTWFEERGNKVSALKAGEAVYLKAKVQVNGDADHVMIEIPIPAGCSYDSKDQQWTNNEIHREYFKEKVSIFCSRLTRGTYTFDVKLMPRFNGKYTLNPAKAEMMYFPVFYGREGLSRVEIK